tara:strand:+ start:5890 stop:6321 length:432 start_codon:yes stop_codon:yes gene_type:complete
MNTNITTAVDSLVKLVNKKGRISLDDAAKELGLPQNILNEWSTFLDQEGILHIEYKFTTPFLISKKFGVNKEKVNIDYDMILRKLQVMEAHLTKAKPAETKQIKQKQYLLKEIKRLMEFTRKKKITKEQLKKLLEYYTVFRRG